ncbi:hypothetical protein GWI33_008323 [Rhynchophorus ferrugineus]|uniref:C2H2-type domain-containing protein n=1 Tax=Rhynchophorus ferrugineus TaxID=354439 RepID=A0A834MMJ9_RHYFE|nr:hypothetical protein GWI33_008323 [Rhynchophorus ferrugineus]
MKICSTYGLKRIVKVEIKEEKFDDDFDPLNKPSGKEKSCPVCSKVLKNNWYLKKHMLTHSEDRPHPCPKCNKKFKTSYQLKTHDVRMHGELQYFECDFCSAKLRSKGSWMIHRRRHLKEYVVKCEMCNMGFVTNQEYINHMGSKHGAGGHMCNICGRTCYDKAALQSHMARHAEGYNENTNIRCEICNKTFLQERYLRHHFQRIHLNGGQRFICDLCGKKVNSKRSLRDHMYIHQGIKPLACKECGKSFGLRTTLKLHIRTHTGQRPYHCTVCGKSFTQRSPLTVHMRHHTGEKPLENKKYYTRRKSKKIGEDADTYSESSSNSTIKLESDYIEVKIKSITFWCQNCNAKFTSEDDLQRHIEQKSCDPEPEVNENVCSICEKVFKEVKYLRIHMKNFHEDPKPRYVCCNRVYSIKEKYEKHRKKFHNDQLDRQPDGSYLCKYCNKTFQAFQSINGHINTYHTKETSYLCNVCGKKYYSLTVLHHHARTHTQAEEMKIKVVFACPSCSREFPTSDSLEAHKTTSHTQHYDKLEDSRFKCKYCDRIFIARISVENHVSSSHLQNKIFLCDNCGRHFYTQSSLKKHEVSHITERNFPCPHCLKKFRIKAELSKHIKVVHMTGTSKSTCSFCLKTFKNESSLKNHINTKHRNEENGVKSTSNSNPTDDIESNIEELFRDSTLKMDDIENNGQNQVFDLTSEIFDEQDAPVEEASESEEIMIYEIYNC